MDAQTNTAVPKQVATPAPRASGAEAKSAIQEQLGQAADLRRRGQFADAMAVVEAALAQFPQSVPVYEEAAVLAEAAGDLDGAFARYRQLRDKMPFNDAGYVRAARLASRHDNRAEAAAMLREARTQLPDGYRAPTIAHAQRWSLVSMSGITLPDAALAVACMPLRAADRKPRHWQEAMRRLEAAHGMFPGDADIESLLAHARSQAGRLPPDNLVAASGATARAGSRRAGSGAAPAGRRRQADAEREEAPDGDTDRVQQIVKQAHALAASDRVADAEALLHEAVTQHPGKRVLWLDYARLALDRSHWDLGVQRLQAALDARPGDAAIVARLAHARIQASMQARPAPPEESAALFGRFESLGAAGAWGCEFGMVQRRMGSETLGLLRWTSINLDMLIRGVRDGFDGVGSDAQTEVSVHGKQYQIRDLKYRIGMHSFVLVSAMSAERMHKVAAQRMGFLRRKLLEDLTAADKVFVYKSKDPRGVEQAPALLEALRSHGDAKVVMGLLADETHPPGSVERIADGLYVGRIKRFVSAADKPALLDFASWQSVCGQVAADVA